MTAENPSAPLLDRAIDRAFSLRKPPRSTYRVQFHKDFTFRHAAAIVPYLARLGVSHLYASPYTKATPGSTHGYDVIDHAALNPELGTQADYDALLATLAQHNMGHILDIVPNHVGVATNENRWWNDVLENGPASRYAGHFDITWKTLPPADGNPRVMLPLLGKPFGQALEDGELKLLHENGRFQIGYFDRRFPLSPESVADEKLTTAALARLNGAPGDATSFDALADLLDKQHYRLAYWRLGPEEINYRRFFDVNDLAALAMENQQTFDDAHELVLRLCAEGKIAGLRVDHPDGLRDPGEYFRRLQTGFVKHVARVLGDDNLPDDFDQRLADRTNEHGIDGRGWPLWVAAEKILAPGESMPKSWPTDGTSGYDFLNEISGLFVDPAGEEAFTKTYESFTGLSSDVAAGVYEAKRFMLANSFGTELNQLAHRLRHLAQHERKGRDFALVTLSEAAALLIAGFPIYRSYFASGTVTKEDIDAFDAARAIADAHARPAVRDALPYLHTLLMGTGRFADAELNEQHRTVVARFEQLTAPVTAKGVEDTFFYRYHRLIALNEVGAEPGVFGLKPEDVHAYLAKRQDASPVALSVLSTHDTKRSEDVRARLYVLSELPAEWADAVGRWRAVNAPLKTSAGTPTAGDEYLLYQSLVGAWPAGAGAWETFIERINAFMLKALREAKTRTNWTDPDTDYEAGVKAFVTAILDRDKNAAFINDFEAFHNVVRRVGVFNSLSQTTLRLLAPGVPDTYQGTELLDFSLVDPDNRRPVDYDARAKSLAEFSAESTSQGTLANLFATADDGRAKLMLTTRLLGLRSAHAALFVEGDYQPVTVTGSRAEHVFAFTRSAGGQTLLVVVPRLLATLLDGGAGVPIGEAVWGDTALVGVGMKLKSALTGESIDSPRVAELLTTFPVGAWLTV